MKPQRNLIHPAMVLILFIGIVTVNAADPTEEALQRGLFEEEANRDLPAAIEAYETVIHQFDEQRHLAATALFRLAECRGKLGQNPLATPH